jgi:hypothetical protein
MTIDNLSPELCQAAIDRFTTPIYKDNFFNSDFENLNGSLIIARVPSAMQIPTNQYPNGEFESMKDTLQPDADFYNQFVVHEHSWGKNEIGANAVHPGTFTYKALQKAFGALYHGIDHDQVVHKYRKWVVKNNLIEYAGGVVGNLVYPDPKGVITDLGQFVAAYSGLWYYDDTVLARTTAEGIRAEYVRRNNGDA